MPRRAVLSLYVVLALASAVATAQSWEGPAGVVVEVENEDGDPIAQAKVTARFGDEQQGPAPVTTDEAGRAPLAGLAEGEWYVEVTHDGYMVYAAYIRLRDGRKPEVAFSSQVNTQTSWTPMRVRFVKASGEVTRTLAERKRSEETREPDRRPAPTTPAPPRREATDARRPAPEESAAEAPPIEAPPIEAPPAQAPPVEAPPVEAPPVETTPAAATPVEAVPAAPQAEMPAAEASEAEVLAAEALEKALEEALGEVEEVAPAAKDRAEDLAEARAAEPPAPEIPQAPAVEPPPAEIPAPPPTPSVETERAEEPAGAPLPETPPGEERQIELPAPEPPAAAAPEAAEPPAPEALTAPIEVPLPQAEATSPPPVPEVRPERTPKPAQPPTGEAVQLPSYLSSWASGDCAGCREGEWAVISQVIVIEADPRVTRSGACPGDLTGLEEAASTLAAAAGDRLGGFAGPAAVAMGGGAGAMVDAATRGRLRDLVSPHGDVSSSCRMVGVFLPAGATFVGYQYEAWDALGGGGCVADRDCPVGSARWHGEPAAVDAGPTRFVFGIFENRSTRRERRAKLTVYFRPPSAGWSP